MSKRSDMLQERDAIWDDIRGDLGLGKRKRKQRRSRLAADELGTDVFRDEVLRKVGVRPDRKRKRGEDRAAPAPLGPLTDTAPAPPVLTHRRCNSGPKCSGTNGRWECHCEDVDPPALAAPRTCVVTGVAPREREDGSLDAFRCQTCAVCSWEKEAERWHQAAHFRPESRLDRPLNRPAFPSLDHAICAFSDWERHDRHGPSAMGPLIDRLRQGMTGGQGGTSYKPGRDDPMLRRAAEVIPIKEAIRSAYPQRNEWRLSPVTCAVLLVAATGGVLDRKPRWDELETTFGIPRATAKSVVRHGQKHVTVELAARGVIPMPPRCFGWHMDIADRCEELEALADVDWVPPAVRD